MPYLPLCITVKSRLCKESLRLSLLAIILKRRYIIGQGDRIRTHDILVPNQALYQTELHPVIFYINNITNSQARSKNKVVLKAPMYTLTAGLLAIYNCYKAAGFTVSRTLALKYRAWNHHISNIMHIFKGPVRVRGTRLGYVITVT